jgi:SAM-dependent methyltransferase
MGLASARFVQASAEELPADLGTFRVVVVAQAFHWFDGPRAAKAIRRVLEPGGHCVVLYAWSLRGDPAPNSGLPEPPYAAMDELSLNPWTGSGWWPDSVGRTRRSAFCARRIGVVEILIRPRTEGTGSETIAPVVQCHAVVRR